jgi:hypothetical protein
MSLGDELRKLYEEGVRAKEEQYKQECHSKPVIELADKLKNNIDNNVIELKKAAVSVENKVTLIRYNNDYLSCKKLQKAVTLLEEEHYKDLKYRYDGGDWFCTAEIYW